MKSEANKKTIKYDKSYSMTQQQNEFYEATVGAYLEKTYPGYWWVTHCEKGVMTVTCPSANKEYGFQFPISKLYSSGHIDLHEIMLAGGEILERHRLNRMRGDLEEIRHADRDLKGNMKHDV